MGKLIGKIVSIRLICKSFRIQSRQEFSHSDKIGIGAANLGDYPHIRRL